MSDRALPSAGVQRRLGLAKTLNDTLWFYLRHFVAFYLFGLVTDLPGFLYSFQEAERFPSSTWLVENTAIAGLEIFLIGFVIAVMARCRLRDREGEQWFVPKSLVDALGRFPTVAGLCLIYAVVVFFAMGALVFFASTFLFLTLPLVGVLAVVGLAILTVYFGVSVAAAAVEDRRGLFSFERGSELTKGNRWRAAVLLVFAVMPLVLSKIAVGFFAIQVLPSGGLSPTWAPLIYSLFTPYYLALAVVMHESLVIIKDGPDPATRAAVFD